jgi:hypothetical protein
MRSSVIVLRLEVLDTEGAEPPRVDDIENEVALFREKRISCGVRVCELSRHATYGTRVSEEYLRFSEWMSGMWMSVAGPIAPLRAAAQIASSNTMLLCSTTKLECPKIPGLHVLQLLCNWSRLVASPVM